MPGEPDLSELDEPMTATAAPPPPNKPPVAIAAAAPDPEDWKLPAVAEQILAEFAPSFNVVGPDGQKFAVAANAAANRANAQITVSRVRAILQKKLKDIEASETVPDVATISELTAASLQIERMALMAYEGKRPLKAGETSEFESLAIGLVHAAASGAAQGGARGGFEAKLAKIRGLGRNRKGSVDIEAKPATTPSL